MTLSDELQPFHIRTDTDPDDAFIDETEAMDDDMYPDELDEGANSLADDDYEEILEDE